MSANDVKHRKRAEDFGRFWKSEFVETRHRTSRDETCLGERRLVFACSRRPLWRVPHVLGESRWKSLYRKIVPLSLCRRTFKLKGNKKFRTWTKKSSSVFRVSRSYILFIYVMNVPCTFRIFVYMPMVYAVSRNNKVYNLVGSKILLNFVRLILQDGFWVVHIPLVCMVKFKFLALFQVDHFPFSVLSHLKLFRR